MTHPAPGTYHNVAVANGEHILYDRPVPVVSPPDDWTVVLVAPVAPPQGAVKPVAVNQAPCTISRAQQHDRPCRAAEHDPRAASRSVDAGTKVTLTVPGGKKYTAKTDKNGLATFRVRPTRSGTRADRRRRSMLGRRTLVGEAGQAGRGAAGAAGHRLTC